MPWRPCFSALVYTLSGEGTVGAEDRPLRTGQLAALREGETVTVRADARQERRTGQFEVLLLGGTPPLRDPVLAGWASVV